MRHTVTILAALVIGIGALSGCGQDSPSSGSGNSASSESAGSDISAYCAAVKDLGDLTAQQGSDELVIKAREIAEVAPADIKADWETFADSHEAALDALNFGIDPSDPSSSLEQMQKKQTSAQDSTAKMAQSAKNIGDHITKTCGK
ncbi:hypothetical protein OHB12_02745 [Nocardia sp. NBC_01730]|uniref:hypothetical protein n=1 Tax=Nocardia sp. NBC_01730 TaxID=2975998 RepID=UPI002E12F6F0|nr:hypothetical protein OHB12_02745 [Nocardia sp. NBC_01730]